jgi:hypothetical protein
MGFAEMWEAYVPATVISVGWLAILYVLFVQKE